jgi:hypothetical protein
MHYSLHALFASIRDLSVHIRLYTHSSIYGRLYLPYTTRIAANIFGEWRVIWVCTSETYSPTRAVSTPWRTHIFVEKYTLCVPPGKCVRYPMATMRDKCAFPNFPKDFPCSRYMHTQNVAIQSLDVSRLKQPRQFDLKTWSGMRVQEKRFRYQWYFRLCLARFASACRMWSGGGCFTLPGAAAGRS